MGNVPASQVGSLMSRAELFRQGTWSLMPHVPDATSKLQSYIVHYCPVEVSSNKYWYGLNTLDRPCSDCSNFPPDEIMGLWKMHNMEYIQNGISH